MAFDPQQDTACVCRFLLVVSIALALTGGYLLYRSSLHERRKVVLKYDETVSQWSDRIREMFDDSTFIVHTDVLRAQADAKPEESARVVRTTHIEGVTIRLRPNSSSEAMADHGTDLNSYTPLRYEQQAPLLSSHIGWPEVDVRLSLTTRARHGGEICKFELGGADGIPLAYRQAYPYSRAECSQRLGGSFSPTTSSCTCFFFLSEVCIKVSLRNGCFAPDAGGGGVGCEPGEENAWSPMRYSRLRGSEAVGGPAFHRDPPAHLDAPMLRVRHVSDPMISAHNLTHDLMTFGLEDKFKALGGFELIVCAMALATPSLIFFFRRWHYGVYAPHSDAYSESAVTFTPLGMSD